MEPEKPFTIDRIFRFLYGIGLFAILFFMVKYLSPVLFPFLIGWLIAYMIHPLVKLFQYKLKFKKRGLSVFAALLTVAFVLFLLFWTLIPALTNEIRKASILLSEYFNNMDSAQFMPAAWIDFLQKNITKADIQSLFSIENIHKFLNQIIPKFWNLLSGSVQFIIGLTVIFVILLYIVFILLDYEKISTGLIEMIPDKYRFFCSKLIDDLEAGMNKYFRGQALVAFIVGVLFSIGFSIVGLPLGITMGLMIGILNLVPYLQIIAIVPIAGLALLQSVETGQSFWWLTLALIIVFVVIQSFQDLILVPKIMGKTMELNPATILLSLSVWGYMLGIVGMIIALPMTTIIISYYKRFILKKEIPTQKINSDK